jgi:hypothetical protein
MAVGFSLASVFSRCENYRREKRTAYPYNSKKGNCRFCMLRALGA